MKLGNTLARMRAMQREQEQAPIEGRSWFRIENRADPSGLRNAAAEIYLYDEIGMWGVPAAAFVAALRDVASPRINLHINSPGGEIFDGVAIYNALRNHPSRVVVYVDGLAASAASFIAMAGAEIITEQTGTMMIHEAQGFCVGTAGDMRELADLLDKLTDTIAGVYALRTGTPADTWRASMAATTWYNADEMVAAGLADRIAGVKDLPAEADGASDVATDDAEQIDVGAEQTEARAFYARSMIARASEAPSVADVPDAAPPARIAPKALAEAVTSIVDDWADALIAGNGTGQPTGVEPAEMIGWDDITTMIDPRVLAATPWDELLDQFMIKPNDPRTSTDAR